MTFCLCFQDGNTPLMLAVESGNQLVVRELLTNKAKEQLKIVKPVSSMVVAKEQLRL